LRDCHSATPFDGKQPCRAVIERSGQHQANDARSEGARRRTKKRVSGRAHPVLLGTAYNAHMIALDHQMVIRRRDVNAPSSDIFAVYGMESRQRAVATQYIR